jgi:hypothetical protein
MSDPGSVHDIIAPLNGEHRCATRSVQCLGDKPRATYLLNIVNPRSDKGRSL